MNELLGQLGGGLYAVLAFAVLLGVVITVHEWGHFFVARRCGVKVLRFSIGFGPALWSRIGRDGTEYVVAAVPLGGYVKMLDEREGEVAPEELPRAFNRKPVAQRFAIVAAGPLVNLVLAVFVYWLLFVAGEIRLAPVIGSVERGSPAAVAGLEAGDEILAVDGHRIRSWDDLPLRVVARVGDTGSVRFDVQRGAAAVEQQIAVPINAFLRGRESENPLSALGLRPWMPPYEVEIGDVLPTVEIDGVSQPGPGHVAGLRKGDRLLRVDGREIRGAPAWVDAVRSAPGRALAVEVARGGDVLTITLVPAVRLVDGRATGYAGVGSGGKVTLRFPEDWPEEYRREVRFGPLQAIAEAVRNTWERSELTVVMIGKMISGALSTDSIGGPLTIAHGASVTMSIGPAAFLDFLALVSITIGILNLLPVPVLDGGHLLFYAVEAVRGRPLSERVQIAATQVGLFMLLALMALALFNDYTRYLAP
ncbi:MAG: RIP metalloprotease RseP [Pseudomonadota bacterium]